MTGRRKSPDGLPFRLYFESGKHRATFFYKLPNGKRAFKLSAKSNDQEAIAKIRKEAIQQAEELNGNFVPSSAFKKLVDAYFAWQRAMPVNSENRNSDSTLLENERESKNLIKVFGKMDPADIQPHHVYGYLDARAAAGAPMKANKEISLLSVILEYGRRIGQLTVNPCNNISFNKGRPNQKYTQDAYLDLCMRTARERGGSYVMIALSLKAAYLTVGRPFETRGLKRSALKPEGIEITVAKRKKGRAQKTKLILWSPELRAVIDEALSLRKIPVEYIFCNQTGGQYSRSGYGTILRRLMTWCEKKAAEEGIEFERFSMMDMRPKAVTDRVTEGDDEITNATGHTTDRMVKQVYDRRTTKKAKATK